MGDIVKNLKKISLRYYLLHLVLRKLSLILFNTNKMKTEVNEIPNDISYEKYLKLLKFVKKSSSFVPS